MGTTRGLLCQRQKQARATFAVETSHPKIRDDPSHRHGGLSLRPSQQQATASHRLAAKAPPRERLGENRHRRGKCIIMAGEKPPLQRLDAESGKGARGYRCPTGVASFGRRDPIDDERLLQRPATSEAENQAR